MICTPIFAGGATCLIDPQLSARIRVCMCLTKLGSDGDRSGVFKGTPDVSDVPPATARVASVL